MIELALAAGDGLRQHGDLTIRAGDPVFQHLLEIRLALGLADHDVSSQGVDPLDIEANAFASELLMPSELFMKVVNASGLDIEDEAGIESIARRFRVSAAAMRYRLANRF